MMCSPESVESIGETERAASILVASRRTVLPNVRVLAPSSVVGRSFLVECGVSCCFIFQICPTRPPTLTTTLGL